MVTAPEGTVTLLFTDIEGSTRLLEAAGDGYSELLLTHRRLLRAAFAAHDGFEVGTEGDAFFVAFASAERAVTAAGAAQRALAEHKWPEGGRVWVRMGLHTGEPRLLEGTYVGLAVHQAARVMAAGHGGQVLVSQATRELLDERFALRDLGEHRLKDLSVPQRLYQLQVAGLPVEFPPLKTLENRPTNLPVQATPLIGRERELEEVAKLISREDVRLLTLTGPGGTGKTRLALQAAADIIDEFANGAYFVSLATVRDPALVLPAIAQTLALREQPGQALAETLNQFLQDKTILLLLDNLEQVTDAASAIAGMLRAAPFLRLLCTSRAPLRISGEHLYAVAPLAVPDLSGAVDADTLARFEAVRLFASRAQAMRPDFAISAANAPAIAELCVRLDGLPLAIELAAARIAVLSPQAMLRRLDQRLKLLTGGSQDADERQQTLLATIEWSYDLLSAEEQRLFARLGIFVGGSRLDAAEAVCDPDGDLGIDIFDGIASLVSKSLLRQRDDPDGEPRFWMLETIREYASSRATNVDALHDREIGHLISTFPPPWDRGSDRDLHELAWLIDCERDNVRDSLSSCLRRGRSDSAQALLARLWNAWFAKGLLREGLAWAEQALVEPLPRPPTRDALELLIGAGEFARFLGNWQRAELLKRQAWRSAKSSALSALPP